MKRRTHLHLSGWYRFWLTILLIVLSSLTLTAHWSRSPGTNTPVCTANMNQVKPVMTADGSGGAIVAWIDARTQTPGAVTGNIACQRLSQDGSRYWEDGGRLLDTTRRYSSLSPMAPDGSGGVFVSGIEMSSQRVVLHRVTSNGTVPWGMAGLVIGTGTSCALSPDGAAGVFVGWESGDSIYVRRVSSNGFMMWGASAPFAFRSTLSGMLCDRFGSAVILAVDRADSSVRVQAVSSNGTVLWGTNGVAVGTGVNPAGVDDTQDGIVIAWSSGQVLYGQRVNASGSLQWSAGGARLCPGAAAKVVRGIDGETIIVGGTDHYPKSAVRAQRIDAGGYVQLGVDGVLVGEGYAPVAVSDGEGGVTIAWGMQDPDYYYDSDKLYAQRLSRVGSRLWGPAGITVTDAPHSHRRQAAVSDGSHGMIVAWEDYRDLPDYYYFVTPSNANIYAQRVRGVGRLGNADIPPVVAGMSPAYGTVGTSITLRGSDFSPIASENVVYFGGARANVTASIDSIIQVFTPLAAIHALPAVTFEGLTGYGQKSFISTPPSSHPLDESSFGPSLGIETGSYPWSVEAGDLNNDGKQDLAIAVYDRNVVAVLRNAGKMGAEQPVSFDAPIELPVQKQPTGVAIADLDGDGKLDIAVCCEGNNTVCVLRNISAGDTLRFAPAVLFPVGPSPKGVAIGDLDGDGRLDIITPDGGGWMISVLAGRFDPWGITDSSFARMIQFGVGGKPVSVVVRDFDGDFRPDIGVACSEISSVTVLRNTSLPGDINLVWPATGRPCGGVPGRMTAGDLDGDGKADIAVGLTDGSSVVLFRNVGTPGTIAFGPKVTMEAGNGVWCIALADFTGDARLDIVTTNYRDGTLSLLENNSTPGSMGDPFTFRPAITIPVGGNPLHAVVSDVNGDGLADIVLADRTGEEVRVMNGREASAAPPRITSFSPSTAQGGDIVTINGTGFGSQRSENKVRIGQTPQYDILTAEPTRLTLRVYPGTSTGLIRVTTNGRTAFSAAPLQTRFQTRGMLDSSAFTPPATLASFYGHIGFDDCDDDGRPEMLQARENSPHSTPFFAPVSLLKNQSGNRNLLFQEVPFPYHVVMYTDPVGSAFLWHDVDGDGKDDILFPNEYDVRIMRNTSTQGSPSFIGAGSISYGGYYETGFLVDDLDGDGKPDLLASSQTYKKNLILRNCAVPGSIREDSFVIAGDGSLIGLPAGSEDFDGDGLRDVYTRHGANNPYLGDSITVYRNTSVPGTFSFVPSGDFWVGEGAVSITDIDGDGLRDLAIANTGIVTIRLNKSGSGVLSFSTPTSITVQGMPIFGDVSGDGLPEMVSPADTIAYVYQNISSRGGPSFAPPRVFRLRGTVAQVVDLNGDGRGDIVAHQPEDSTFSVLQSIVGSDPVAFAPEFRICNKTSSIAFLDVDGDGSLDAVIAERSAYKYVGRRNRIGDSYPLLAYADSNGSISPSGWANVLHGGTQVYSWGAKPGYSVDSVVVDGVRVDSLNTYTFVRVTSPHTIAVYFQLATVVEGQAVPAQVSLLQNFPNPFNPETEIRFSVETRGPASLRVYNLLGQEVQSLFEGIAEPGRWYKVSLDGRNVASGLYFYRLQSGGRIDTKKLLLLK
jgi:hypothetical protein